MQIYKDTLALEACPAKTAETVSYGATFTVLGWILLSNYSGFDYADQRIESATSPSGKLITPTVPIVNDLAAYAELEVEVEVEVGAEVEVFTEKPFPPATLNQPEAETVAFVTKPPSWYADLSPFQQHRGQTHQRAFSTVNWNVHTSDSGQQITGLIKELVLPLPLIDTAYILDANGAVADRPANRTGNIHRPQIPRPYRAQEIQRSIVRPPRIQALRP